MRSLLLLSLTCSLLGCAHHTHDLAAANTQPRTTHDLEQSRRTRHDQRQRSTTPLPDSPMP